MRRPLISFTLSVTLLVASLTACSDTDDTATSNPAGPPLVAVAFYPVQEIVQSVAGKTVKVDNLTPAGQSPHEVELTAGQVTNLSKAKAVFYLGQGFQPQIEAAVNTLDDSVLKVDLLDSVELLGLTDKLAGTAGETDGEELASGKDPHVWVSPKNMVAMTDTVTASLQKLLPSDSASFATGAATYDAKLAELTNSFTTGLKTCDSRTIVTSHRAFEYLSRDFDLVQVPIAGLSPDAEPDPKTLEAVAAKAKADKVTTIFFENNLPAKLSDTIAREVGATTDTLDPIESLTPEQLKDGTTYISIQERNLVSLRAALRCT